MLVWIAKRTKLQNTVVAGSMLGPPALLGVMMVTDVMQAAIGQGLEER